MKKYIKNIALAVTLLGCSSVMLTSCEDTLEKPSFTADDLDYVFSDLQKADLFVKGCYRGLIHKEQWYQYGAGDNVTYPTEEACSGSKWRIGNYDYDPYEPVALYTTYNEGYRIIESCNNAIKRLGGMGESAKRNALLAECYFIRAFVYHNLIRFYGDVPAVWEPLENLDPNDPETYTPHRTQRDVIYDRIIKEMNDHVEDLPWFSEAEYGSAPERLSRQAAYGVIARVCLHAGGYSLRWDFETNDPATMQMARRDDPARVRELYEIADNALAKVMEKGENSLIKQGTDGMSAFQTLFYNYCQRNYGVSSQEYMWQLASYGSDTNTEFGLYTQPGSVGGLYGQRKTLQSKLPTYFLSFDPKDTRRDVTCCNYTVTYKNTNSIDDEWSNVGTTYSCVGSGKFRIQWTVGPADAAAKRNVDIPVLRYADILLMRAETQNFLFNGPTGIAKSCLQEVRDRAGVGHLAIPASQDEFQRALMQERQWELADELTLRTDLIRMNLLDDEVKKAKADLRELSDHTGKYADVPTYRLYRYEKNAQVYGDKFLSVPYIELTDPDEINLIKTAPNTTAKMKTFQQNILKILENHGITDGVWYPMNMFEQWNSTYNKNSRRGSSVGFSNDMNSTIQVGASAYTKPTQKTSSGYPEWIDQMFFGYEKNKVELMPFASGVAGHPRVDNPNLSQHPGYL